MSQCVPTWEVDDGPLSAVAATKARPSLPSPANSAAADIPMLDYEVAELAWENGQLVMHGLGPPRVAAKSPPSFSPSPWDKQSAGGTLESIVNQATMRLPNPNYSKPGLDADKPIPLFDHHRFPSCSATPAGGSTTVTMDALVPCSNHQEHLQKERVMTDTVPGLGVECLTRVGSCSDPLAGTGQGDEEALVAAKRARVAARGPAAEWSVTGSATGGRDHSRRRVTTVDTYEMDVGMGFTSTSNGSPANTTSSGKPFTKTAVADDHDSVCHSRPQATSPKTFII